MQRFLLLLLLLATPARADDFGSITWNSAKGVFQAALHALGTKDIPDAESGSFSSTFSSGPWASMPTVTFYYSRVGKQVTIATAALLQTAAATQLAVLPSGAVPASLRPTSLATFSVCIWSSSGGSDYTGPPGTMQVGTNGSLSIYKSVDKTNWSAGSTNGWNAWSCTYSIQ